MARSALLSRPQQHAVLTANSYNLVVKAKMGTLLSLTRRGLAEPPRNGVAFRLSPRGVELREQLACPVPTAPVSFGNGGISQDPSRGEAIAAAWQAMLAHRDAYGPDGEPAVWERLQPMRAAAIILEAGGAMPSATDEYGRRVRAGYILATPTLMPWAVRVQHRVPYQWEEVGHPDRREAPEIEEAHDRAYRLYCQLFEEASWKTQAQYSTMSGNRFLLAKPHPAT